MCQKSYKKIKNIFYVILILIVVSLILIEILCMGVYNMVYIVYCVQKYILTYNTIYKICYKKNTLMLEFIVQVDVF